jgi:uncharacterized protein with GYD domain
MIRLVTRGRLTQNYAKSFLAAPENREPAVRKLIEAAGGKLINFYFTPGDSDFLLISEANDAEKHYCCVNGSSRGGHDFRCNDREGMDWCGIQGNR